jgi:hypothetical protein
MPTVHWGSGVGFCGRCGLCGLCSAGSCIFCGGRLGRLAREGLAADEAAAEKVRRKPGSRPRRLLLRRPQLRRLR